MTNQVAAQIDAAAAGSNQVLTFTLGDETYGVDILRVQEIRGWQPVTRIPQAPSHVLGVLNLRGSIVPIVDLRHALQPAACGIHPAHRHHRAVGAVARSAVAISAWWSMASRT